MIWRWLFTLDTVTIALSCGAVQLGAALGINTVAEGIEDMEQLVNLRREDCVQGQGYLFARPLDSDGLRAYLLEKGGQPAEALLLSRHCTPWRFCRHGDTNEGPHVHYRLVKKRSRFIDDT